MPRVAVLTFALLTCWAAPAATLQQLSTDQLTQSSTAVVRACVTDSSASFTGSTIYTHYKLQVTELWKGFPPTELMLPGGIAADGAGNRYRQSFPGVPQLQVGVEYVMFLWTSSSTGITHLTGLTQGLFNLGQLPDGTTMAIRPIIGEMMLNAAGRKVADQAVAMKLSDLKTRVTQAIRPGAAK
jgi:hypothetical protein